MFSDQMFVGIRKFYTTSFLKCDLLMPHKSSGKSCEYATIKHVCPDNNFADLLTYVYAIS